MVLMTPPADLSRARILVTNDDGIRAAGIGVLERVALSLSDDVWVVAPETEQSATGHSLTIHRPLRIREQGPRHYAVDGTPTDAVLLGVHHVLRKHPPDLVLSGVNMGSNLADDITYSGTVAAAMEATILGYPAFAFSQIPLPDGEFDWRTAERFAGDIVRRAVAQPWQRNVLINVNFPAAPPDEVTGVFPVRLGTYAVTSMLDTRTDPRGRPYFWIGPMSPGDSPPEDDTDLGVIDRGGIAVTPLSLDMTHRPMLDGMIQAFG